MATPEESLSECLADYRSRRASGELVSPVEYASRLGEHYGEFASAVEAETLIDDLIEAPAVKELPRPFGPFTLVRELGRGAGGVVYEAEQTNLNRSVAVKLLREGFENDSLAREHFVREAGICAQLKHPNIVDIYDAGEVEGTPFFAMEMIDGTTLGDWMRRDDRPDVRTLCGRLADVADALSKLHERGIVHRDIKPSNIMATSDGKLMLTDFGMARTELAETLARTGVALGTPLYMSPEQLLGKRNEIGGRSDVYGLGATLFECLCGRAPFETDDANALVRMILNERPPNPTTLSTCPTDASRVVLKCLEKNIEDRYRDAAELRDDLRRLANGEPVLGRPLGTSTRVMRAVVRRPRASIAVAATIAFAAIFAWYSLTRPGWLNADIVPDGSVSIEAGSSWGKAMTAPLHEHELAPGEYRVKFASRGFHPQEATVRVTPGSTIEKVVRLKVKDPSDPDVLERVCRAMGIGQTAYAGPPKTLQRSSVESVDAYPLWPRGRVRTEDLDTFTACIGVDYDPKKADLVIQIDGEVVHRDSDFDPDDLEATVPIPEQVQRKLLAANRFSWGFELEGKQTWAECELVQPDLNARFTVLHEMLPEDTVDPRSDAARARHLLTARALHAEGLYTAAWNELGRALRDGSRDRLQRQALLIRYDSMKSAAGSSLTDLKTVELFTRIEQALRSRGWEKPDRR